MVRTIVEQNPFRNEQEVSSQPPRPGFQNWFHTSVGRSVLRVLCLIFCCIGCPNDPMFQRQRRATEEDWQEEIVLGVINGEDAIEPRSESEEDWDADDPRRWHHRYSVKTLKREAEIKVTDYDEELHHKSAIEMNSFVSFDSSGEITDVAETSLFQTASSKTSLA